MKKGELRNQLFNKYFDIEDGILATDLVDKLSFIPELWKKLHLLCENNIEYFDALSTLEKIKVISYKQKKCLILKLRMFQYVIIDIDKNENITEEEFKEKFDEDFFVNNFDEIKPEDNKTLFNLYHINKYNGDVQELIDFYVENHSLLELSTELHYRLNIEEAWTYFFIDFVNAEVQMGFQTPDQFLYEQLFLRYDLTPSRSQDAQEKIGVSRMQEMFEKIKDLRIPIEVIPNDLYQQFLNQCNTRNYNIKKAN